MNQRNIVLVLSILFYIYSFVRQNIDLEFDSPKIQFKKSKEHSCKINLLYLISIKCLDIDIDSGNTYRKKVELRSLKFNTNLILRLELLKIREFIFDYQLPLEQKSILNFKEKYLRTCTLENKLEFLYFEGLYKFSANKINEGINFWQSTLKKHEDLQLNIIPDYHLVLSCFFLHKLIHLNSFDQLSKSNYIYSKKNNQIGIYQVNYNFYITYINLEKYYKELIYLQKVISNKKIIKNRYQIIQDSYLLWLNFFHQEKYKKAVEFFDFVKNDFLNFFDVVSNTFYIKNLSLYNIGLPSLLINNCNEDINNYEVESELFSINYLLLISCNELNKFYDAKLYSVKLNNLLKTNTKEYLNTDDKFDNSTPFTETEKGFNNFQEAILLFEKFNKLYCSYYYSLNIVEVSECLSSIEIKQKETQVKDLTIAAQKNKVIIIKKENLKNFLKIIIVFGLVLCFITYIFYRKIKKNNSKLKIQNLVISNSNAIILQTLKEKETLLKEIHHRVKNNLQLVMSLLKIQASGKENTSIEEFIEKGQSRIASMILIHENLYQINNIGNIDFETYIESLVKNIRITFGVISERIAVHIKIENIFFDIKISIPLGLIINELVTNSFKHGFPNNRRGSISILLHKSEQVQDGYLLEIVDDGIGINTKEDDRKSLGLELVNLLVMQLNGTIKTETMGGTRHIIYFIAIKS